MAQRVYNEKKRRKTGNDHHQPCECDGSFGQLNELIWGANSLWLKIQDFDHKYSGVVERESYVHCMKFRAFAFFQPEKIWSNIVLLETQIETQNPMWTVYKYKCQPSTKPEACWWVVNWRWKIVFVSFKCKWNCLLISFDRSLNTFNTSILNDFSVGAINFLQFFLHYHFVKITQNLYT